MEIALTKLSANGQIVIPSEVRKEAGLTPATKFLVFNDGKDIVLKQITSETLREEMALLKKIHLAEQQITAGKVTKVTTEMSDEKIVNKLTN
ncbi:AbrB/MazE/SpoVT family DNA-binding domain-containing protein [Candidatus Woesearchaeota archaeon]|nr:AbrB/MazE/SpoVT family DNA-binding domain-containing protein [Candidatus Woesearchaeota archaeon]